jgi:hypothetical protein
MAFNLFGYRFTKDDTTKSAKGVEKIAQQLPDGAAQFDVVQEAGHHTYSYDFEVEIKKESDLINTYRAIMKIADVDSAVDDIVNEAIVVEHENPVIELTFTDDTKFSENIQTKIIDEYKLLLNMMDFDINGPQMFRQWFIDGKHYYHKVVDKNKLKDGIMELNWLDPCKVKKIRENIVEVDNITGTEKITGYKEFFVYDPNSDSQKKTTGGYASKKTVLKLEPDSVAYTNSGLIDMETGRSLSHLHKAVKPANQLSLMRDSMVVYRLSRAPERRIFYIDVGNLPKARAEEYMKSIINKYKNKLAYNVEDGTVKANKNHLSMLEDIWLPRKEGGKGTEVSTLDGAQNLGDIEDVVYFQKQLYEALNLPPARMDNESVFNIGNSNEISRDEIKFTKFIHKLRGRFNKFFLDLLKTQLLLKNKITEAEWEREKTNFEFVYNVDSHFAEVKKNEVIAMRLESLANVDAYVGRYFSIEWVRKNVLNMTDEEIKEIDKQIAEEQKKGESGESPDTAFGGMDVVAGGMGAEEAGLDAGDEPADEPAAPADKKPEPQPEPKPEPKQKDDTKDANK